MGAFTGSRSVLSRRPGTAYVTCGSVCYVWRARIRSLVGYYEVRAKTIAMGEKHLRSVRLVNRDTVAHVLQCRAVSRENAAVRTVNLT